jgi:exosortase D (VPLPA-CTERM-specific)
LPQTLPTSATDKGNDMTKMFEGIKIKPVSWLKAAIYTVSIVAGYYSALEWMVSHDWVKEDYSHCYLIPIAVLYLLWEKRNALATIPSKPSWTGFIPVGVGICLYWLGELGGEFFTMYMSLWLVILGLTWIHVGWKKLKTIGFAFILMLTMFPFPNVINTKITFQLKLISSKVGVWMLHLYGMSAFREGNVIDLGFTQLQVVDACSGLRYVMPLMVLSLILAYWFKTHLWKRVALFLSSIPISIIVNSMRIAITGALYPIMGAQAAEGFFHDFSGWLIFMVTVPVLLGEMWVLKWLPPRSIAHSAEGREEPQEKGEGRREKGEAVEPIEPIQPIKPIKRPLLEPVFIVALVLLVSTLALSKTVEFREKIPIKKPLNEFPLKVAEWSGSGESMEEKFIKELDLNDYVIVNYKNAEGKDVNFYTAYYESQRKGESIHSPETCLPAGGWAFNEAGATDIALGSGKSMRVNKAFMEKSGYRQLTYYWFPMRGRVLTNIYQMKWYGFWDALTRQRTDGALVRLITPVYEKEDLKDAEARLQGFMREIVPILDEYIPK